VISEFGVNQYVCPPFNRKWAVYSVRCVADQTTFQYVLKTKLTFTMCVA
jgi:hypothetical protein